MIFNLTAADITILGTLISGGLQLLNTRMHRQARTDNRATRAELDALKVDILGKVAETYRTIPDCEELHSEPASAVLVHPRCREHGCIAIDQAA